MDKMNYFKTKVLAKFMVKVPIPSVGMPDYLDTDYAEIGRSAHFGGHIQGEIGDIVEIKTNTDDLNKFVMLCYTTGVQYRVFPENAEIWS